MGNLGSVQKLWKNRITGNFGPFLGKPNYGTKLETGDLLSNLVFFLHKSVGDHTRLPQVCMMWELAIILAIWFCRRLTYQHIIFVLENRKPRLQGKTFMLGHVLLTMCTETSSYLLCSNGDQVKRRGV